MNETLKAHAQRKVFSFYKLSQERSVAMNDPILHKIVKGMCGRDYFVKGMSHCKNNSDSIFQCLNFLKYW